MQFDVIMGSYSNTNTHCDITTCVPSIIIIHCDIKGHRTQKYDLKKSNVNSSDLYLRSNVWKAYENRA